MPVKNASATLGVNSLGANKTEIYMKIEMTPNNRLMQPMMYLMFKYKVIPGILKGLEDLYIVEHKLETKLHIAS